MLEYIKKSKNYTELCDVISCENQNVSLTGIISSCAASVLCALSSDEKRGEKDKKFV